MDEPRSDDTPTEEYADLGRRWRDYIDGRPPEASDDEPPSEAPAPAEPEDAPGTSEPRKPGAGATRSGSRRRADASLRAALRDGGPEPPGPPVVGGSRLRWLLVGTIIVAAPLSLFVLAQQGGSPDARSGGSAVDAPAERTVAADSLDLDSLATSPGPSRDTAAAPDPSSAAGAGGTTAETDTPELLDLTLRGTPALAPAGGGQVRGAARALTVPAGTEGRLRVSLRREGGRPAAGVPVVLEGSAELPAASGRLTATTDSAGTAVFRLAVGARPDTLPLEVLARGYWLRGDNRVELRVVP